uniref:hypothetical protein n=1 Tax=Candidatus Electronema sp. TaxID=2698783 RepID=UPI004055A896
MGKIGDGYGSEWHLLRHLRCDRAYFSRKVAEAIGGQRVEWLDFKSSPVNEPLKDDREFIGLEFIQDIQVQKKWKEFWPQTGNTQNWDAVGQIYFEDTPEWLLLEAKGHIGEIKSKCGAKKPNSKKLICSALEETREAVCRPCLTANWLEPYYQYANRLAVLYFLLKKCMPAVKARLLFIYFYGENRKGCNCPQSEQEWYPAIKDMTKHLGIDNDSELMKSVHCLFLPVNPDGVGVRIESR